MSKKVKLGILSFAHLHATAYAEAIKGMDEVELLGIYDDNEYRGVQAAAEYETEYFRNIHDLLDRTEGVIITSENSLHANLAREASSTGNNVLCEKPIATTLEDAESMIESSHNSKGDLYTAFPVRFNPSIQALRSHVESGEIGDLLGISSTNHGTLPPGWFVEKEKSGGGSLIDHTVHLVDLFRWIFNIEVKEVYTRKGTLLNEIEVEDCGLTTLEFDDGSFATIDSSWSRPDSFPTWGDLKMRVYGSKGVIDLNAFNQKIRLYTDKEKSNHWDYWGTDMNRQMIKDFVKAITEPDYHQELATGEDGKKVLETALATYQSAEANGLVTLE